MHRYDGQMLYIKTITYGVVCTSLGILVVSGIDQYFNFYSLKNYLYFNLFSGIDLEYRSKMVWIFFVFFTSIISAELWVWYGKTNRSIKVIWPMIHALLRSSFKNEFKNFPAYKYWPCFFYYYITFLPRSIFYLLYVSLNPKIRMIVKEKYIRKLMYDLLKDSPMDKLFFESYDEELPIMMTLKDNKVYVGTVVSLGEPSENNGLDQEIVITPFLSGYRTEHTLEICFTTSYPEVDSDISLVLRQDQVLSATVFDYHVFEAFKKQGRNQMCTYDSKRESPMLKRIVKKTHF